MNGVLNSGLAVVGAIISLAIIATLVSKNAQTAQVVSAASGALSNVIKAAVSPLSAANNGDNNSTFTTPNVLGSALGGLLGSAI